MTVLQGKPFDDLTPGQRVEMKRTLDHDDILAFASVSGDVNPAHLDADYAAATPFHDVIGHGLWTGSLVSSLIGTQLPGPGSIYLSQSFEFLKPIKVGDQLTVSVTVKEKRDKHRVVLDCSVHNQNDEAVLSGTAIVLPPKSATKVTAKAPPTLLLPERGHRLRSLIDDAKQLPALRTAIVHPVNEATLQGALAARDDGLIDPALIGPREKIHAALASLNRSADGLSVVEVPHSHAAGEKAAQMAADGEVAAIMKGALHTDEVLTPILDRAHGLRTERRLSHIYVMDAPAYHKLLLLTDAAVNVAPSLEHKADILFNAGRLARALGITAPKAAILSAVESVTPAIPSTLEAAGLCKMVERGQIPGILAEGPLAFDNAISKAAATIKGLTSPVAGDADILLAPDLEAGNIMAKQLDYLGGAVAGGIVLGARIPIILSSRAEGLLPRRASCALASLLHHRGEAP